MAKAAKKKAKAARKKASAVPEPASKPRTTSGAVHETAAQPANTTPTKTLAPNDNENGHSAKKLSQVNVRIASELKEQGERAFAEAGLTSSDAIRMLYEFAARNERTPAVIAKTLSQEGGSKEQRRVKAAEILEHGRSIVPNLLRELEVKSASPETISEIVNMNEGELLATTFAEDNEIEV